MERGKSLKNVRLEYFVQSVNRENECDIPLVFTLTNFITHHEYEENSHTFKNDKISKKQLKRR